MRKVRIIIIKYTYYFFSSLSAFIYRFHININHCTTVSKYKFLSFIAIKLKSILTLVEKQKHSNKYMIASYLNYTIIKLST